MKKINTIKSLFAIIILFWIYSCTVIQEYDKIYLYDEDMLLSPTANELFEISVQTYREGASASFGGNNGGGCGCY